MAQSVSSGSAWTSTDRSGADRSTGPRLQLLGQMVKRMHDRDAGRVSRNELKMLKTICFLGPHQHDTSMSFLNTLRINNT